MGGVKGVLVVTSQAASTWVGPQPAWKTVLRHMREVRCLSGIVMCNFSGRPIDKAAEDIDVWNGEPTNNSVIPAAVAKFVGGGEILIAQACTPLIPAAVMERVAETMIEGADLVQTCLRFLSASQLVVGQRDVTVYPSFDSGYAPVHGVRAFRSSALDSPALPFVPVEVTKVQALSLLDECDKGIIEALEYAGRI